MHDIAKTFMSKDLVKVQDKSIILICQRMNIY